LLVNLLTGTLAKNNSTQRKSQLSSKAKRRHDCSGSCAIVMLVIEKECYIANLGDSRGLMSLNEMSRFYTLTNDHKPEENDEKKRIESNGGKIWKQGFNPYRVIPGGLSVSS
jgi:serine/threonine protein phosphatase PrpC